jgi:ankyrin repeat protein
VDLLLTHGADPNHIITNRSLQTTAAEVNRTTAIRNAAAIRYQGRKWTVLHVAAHLGRMRAIKALCNAHAQTTSIDEYGCSPVDVAMVRAAVYLRRQSEGLSYKRLCADCSLALVTGMFDDISHPGRYSSGCNLCQLLLDCGFTGAHGLRYNKSDNGKGNVLTVTSARDLVFHHPMLKVTGELL